MVRVPAEVVGRTRPSQTPLAQPAQTADANAFGAQAFQSLGRLGNALQQGALALRERRSREATMRANLAMTTFQLDQDRVLDDLNRNRDEFSNIDVLYEDQYNVKMNELLESIEDPEARAHAFEMGTRLFAKNTLAAQNAERERNAAAVDLNLTKTAESSRIVVRRDPSALNEQVEIVADALQQSGGVLPRAEIEKRAREYLQGLNVSALDGRSDRNPELVLSELNTGVTHTPGEADLVYSESGGNPRVVNSEGYAGLYQFGAPRLADIGVYSPGEGEELREWQGDWTGRFNIPGHPNVKSLGDFLASREAQHTAYKLHKQKMDVEIRDNGFDRFIGQHVQGVLITQQGLHNMLHLGGVGSTRTFLSGKGNPEDSNGTSMADYASMGSQGPQSVVPLEEILTPRQWEHARNYAQSVLDDRIRRQGALETEQATNRTLAQEQNYAGLQVAVATGRASKADAVEALSAGRISTTQYRTLLTDIDTANTEASQETALQLESGLYTGEVGQQEIMAASPQLTFDQRADLIRKAEEVGRRGGVLANENVQQAAQYVKKSVGAVPGPLGRFDEGELRREANALREFNRAVTAGGEDVDPWQIADELVARFRPTAPALSDLVPPRGFEGGFQGTPEQVQERAGESLQRLRAQFENNEMSREEWEATQREFIHFGKQLQQLQNNQLLLREGSNNARQ